MTRITKKPFTKEEFDAIYTRVPRLAVELIVRTPQGIILTKRSMEPRLGEWHIPGGTVFFGETLVQAVERVGEEELGVKIIVGKQLGIIEYPGMLADGYKGWPVGAAFEANIASGTPSGSDQGEEIGYFQHVPENTVPDQEKWLNEHVFAPRT
jgi:ADP-ribose pyrophosphatase YjhB (NUDIX family)